jgi:hypothetical protein
MFEEAALITEKASARFSNVYLQSRGGLRVTVVGLFDQQLASACSFETSRDQVMRCFPPPTYQSDLTLPSFADAGCQTTLVGLGTVGCEPPPATAYVWRGESLACGQHANEIYRAGRTVSADSTFLRTPTECRAQRPPGPTWRAVEVGARIPDGDLPAFSLVTSGPHRLVPVSYAEAGGAVGVTRVTTPDLYDSARKELCRYGLHADGRLRCLPDAAFPVFFLDSACTMKAALRTPTACGGTPAYAVVREHAAGGCSDLTQRRLYMVGAKMAAAPAQIFLPDAKGVCQPSALPAGAELLTVGEEIPAAAFVSGRETME